MSKRGRTRREERRRTRDSVRQAGGGLHGLAVHAMSRMRFSLTFRIALHFCAQLIRTMLLEAMVLTLCVGVGLFLVLRDDIDRIRVAEVPASGLYEQNVIQNDAITALYYADTLPLETSDLLQAMLRDNLSSLPGRLSLRVSSLSAPGTIRVRVRMTEVYRLWLVLMAGALGCDLLRMLYFMRHHSRLNRRVLAPIQDIT